MGSEQDQAAGKDAKSSEVAIKAVFTLPTETVGETTDPTSRTVEQKFEAKMISGIGYAELVKMVKQAQEASDLLMTGVINEESETKKQQREKQPAAKKSRTG
jgi:hypothetical protein